jgi:hypothetical protein
MADICKGVLGIVDMRNPWDSEGVNKGQCRGIWCLSDTDKKAHDLPSPFELRNCILVMYKWMQDFMHTDSSALKLHAETINRHKHSFRQTAVVQGNWDVAIQLRCLPSFGAV